MTARSGSLATVLVLCLAILAPSASLASCAPVDPRETLEYADAAFIGTADETTAEGRDPVTPFDVQRVVKGQLPDELQVHGFRGRGDRQLPVLLLRHGDRWEWLGGCSRLTIDQLLEASRPLEGISERPAALVVGLRLLPARLVALDELGQPVAYGRGAGDTFELSVCPGSTAVAEHVQVGNEDRVALRSLPSLNLEWERGFGNLRVNVMDVMCAKPEGAEILVLTTGPPEDRGSSHVYRVTESGVDEVSTFTADWGFLSADHIVIWPMQASSTVEIRAIETGSLVRKVRLPEGTRDLEISPDGSMLAGRASPEPGSHGAERIVLVELSSQPPTVRTRSLPHDPVAILGGGVEWLDRSRVAVYPDGFDADRGLVYDTALQQVGQFGRWLGQHTTLLRGRLYGVGYSGGSTYLMSTPASGGEVEYLQRFNTGYVWSIASVDERPRELRPRPTGLAEGGAGWLVGVIAAGLLLAALLTGAVLRGRARH